MARTILKVVPAYARHSGWFVDARPSVRWYTYSSHALMCTLRGLRARIRTISYDCHRVNVVMIDEGPIESGPIRVDSMRINIYHD